MSRLLSFTEKGIYCERADVFVDPWKPVRKAIITHAHADHARWGMDLYLGHTHTIPFLNKRLGTVKSQGAAYHEPFTMNGVKISLHPAGHIPGSSQVRFEYKGQVWVVSGDYKIDKDNLSESFEPLKCHVFITESTFGLPVFHWPDPGDVFAEINSWWKKNIDEGKTSVLFGYSLGKSQRLLAGLDKDLGKIHTHGAVENLVEIYREMGYKLPPTIQVGPKYKKGDYSGAIVVAPPSALGSPWMRKFLPYSTGLASGWMILRGAKRRRNVDRGFVLSDHADWSGLNHAVKSTGAEKIFVTHGYADTFTRWLKNKGYDAAVVKTEFEGELEEIGESRNKEESHEEI